MSGGSGNFSTANLLGNPLSSLSATQPAGSSFNDQFTAAPLSLLNQMASGSIGAGQAYSGPTTQTMGPSTTNLTNYSGALQGQQPPWWSAFYGNQAIPLAAQNPAFQTWPSNFSSMWGMQNPSLLPLLLLMSSRALSPAQMTVPPIGVPAPLPPVIQPGNPAGSPWGGGGGGEGGGEGEGEGAGMGDLAGQLYNLIFHPGQSVTWGPGGGAITHAGGLPVTNVAQTAPQVYQAQTQISAPNQAAAYEQAAALARNAQSNVSYWQPGPTPQAPPEQITIDYRDFERGL